MSTQHEMSMALTSELVAELERRHDAFVFIGAVLEAPAGTIIAQRITGDRLLTLGLLAKATAALASDTEKVARPMHPEDI